MSPIPFYKKGIIYFKKEATGNKMRYEFNNLPDVWIGSLNCKTLYKYD